MSSTDFITSLPPYRRYFITLGYDGTNFVGWQEQPMGRTVQGVLQEALSIILRTPVLVVGAGRTDAQVHALKGVCHIDLPEGINFSECEFIYRCNSFLPKDIRLYSIREVVSDAHARFSAVERSYGYYVTTLPTPFNRHYQVKVPITLDFSQMNLAAKALVGRQDFTTFSKKHTDVFTHICDVTKAEWSEIKPMTWKFTITSNRFLRNMVRSIVGSLFEVGRHKITPEQFRDKLNALDRRCATVTAPAKGLFLEEVVYPLDIFLRDDFPPHPYIEKGSFLNEID